MLIWFVVIYLLISASVGLYVATRVHNTKDFAVAGRSLPFPVVTATVFATWFGAEAVFGVSATFVKDGLRGVVADPFGASLCLIIAGLFYGTKLYKLNILTLGDFFRLRYNRGIEVLTTLCIIFSYIGWVSAQVKALGLVLSVITHGVISPSAGTVIGAAVVLTYTTFGGMLSAAILDFLQMGAIIGGLLFIAWIVSGMNGGAAAVIAHASGAGKLNFFPEGGFSQWFSFIGAWITMMLGSIPQQDVFQRVTSAKSAKTAVYGSLMGGSIYFLFTFVPMFIAYAATLVDPVVFNDLIEHDSQLVLPMLVLHHMPVFAQAIFFGAILSAIMSTSAATLLAPSVAFSENIVRGFVPDVSDQAFLRMMRLTTVGFACIVLTFALRSNAPIFKMVENAYKITLVGAFVPLFFGAYWKKSTTQGAFVSIISGVSSWLLIEIFAGEDTLFPPQLIGFAFSLLGMIAGSLLPQKMVPTHQKECGTSPAD